MMTCAGGTVIDPIGDKLLLIRFITDQIVLGQLRLFCRTVLNKFQARRYGNSMIYKELRCQSVLIVHTRANKVGRALIKLVEGRLPVLMFPDKRPAQPGIEGVNRTSNLR